MAPDTSVRLRYKGLGIVAQGREKFSRLEFICGAPNQMGGDQIRVMGRIACDIRRSRSPIILTNEFLQVTGIKQIGEVREEDGLVEIERGMIILLYQTFNAFILLTRH